jgi:predicted permease
MNFRRLRNRGHREGELDEEIQSHIAMAIRDRVERGEDPQEAEFAVRREFGNQTLVREVTREMWGWRLLGEISRDIRYALRSMKRSPGLTAVVVISLALGIGANTAIFSVMYAVMLRSLDVPHPEELVELLQKYPGEPRGNGYWTPRSYEYYRDHNHVFSGLTGMAIDNMTRFRTDGSEEEHVIAEYVVENYFQTLGVKPALGRLLGSGEGAAVISWSLWDSRFHQDPGVLGKRIFVDDAIVTIAGVAPRKFTGLRVNAQTSLWLPAKPKMGLNLVGRLKPGVTLQQARAEMAQLFRFTIEERTAGNTDPQVRQLRIELEPARAGLADVRDRVGKPVSVLMAISAMLLLLACVNVAGLLLARAASRTREMALRLGLGASRGRLIRQGLTESFLLSLLGTLAGVTASYFGTPALLAILDSGRTHERVHLQVQADGSMLLFTASVAVLMGLLLGLAPALSALRENTPDTLRQAGKTLETRSHRNFGRLLVAAQVALSMLLLSAGGLFLAHLATLKSADLGFQRDHVLLVRPDPSQSGYKPEQLSNIYRELLEEMQVLPGVRSASLSAPTPLSGAGASGFATAEGFEERPEDKRWISLAWVGPKYFETLRTPILWGREFNFEDQANPRIAIINQTLARYYFAGRNPVGKRITLDHVTGNRQPTTYEIAGVAGDANYGEIRETDRRIIYLPAFRNGRVTAGTFVLRTHVDPTRVAGEVRRVIHEKASSIRIEEIKTLSDQIDASIVPERLMAVLSGLFGILGALLAGIGLYGLLAYTVIRRTSEIGVRMALGATPGGISRMLSREALAIVAAGVAMGWPAALWGRTLAASMVQDLTTDSTVSVGIGVAAIVVIALLASYGPARRAARVDPMESLRHE